MNSSFHPSYYFNQPSSQSFQPQTFTHPSQTQSYFPLNQNFQYNYQNYYSQGYPIPQQDQYPVKYQAQNLQAYQDFRDFSSDIPSEYDSEATLQTQYPQQYMPVQNSGYQQQYQQVSVTQNYTQPTPLMVPQATNAQSTEEEQPSEEGETENSQSTFTKEEEMQLVQFAGMYRKDWKKVTKKFSEITNKKCSSTFLKNQYKRLTCGSFKERTKFSLKEDMLIAKYFKLHGTHWEGMVGFFKSRDAVMLKNRYYAHIRKRGLTDSLQEAVEALEARFNRALDNLSNEDILANTNFPGYESEKQTVQNPESNDSGADDVQETMDTPVVMPQVGPYVQQAEQPQDRFQNWDVNVLMDYIATLEGKLKQSEDELASLKRKIMN